MKAVITQSTKNKAILSKAVVPRRRYRTEGEDDSWRGGVEDSRRDHHKRSRRDDSRSRSPHRDSNSNSRRGQRGGGSSSYKRKRSSCSGDKANRKPKNDKKGNSYSFPEPQSSI